MSRKPRNYQPSFTYHITTRCNNREFRLTRVECREVFLYAIKKAQDKYRFKLYALCINTVQLRLKTKAGVGWVEERNPTLSRLCWVSLSLNPTYYSLN